MSGRPGIYGHPNNPQSNSHPHPATKSTLPLECELLHLGLVCYLQNLVDAGFDTWEAVQDINEWDMAIVCMKLGHRRKLQRHIANSRGLPGYVALEPTIVYYPVRQ